MVYYWGETKNSEGVGFLPEQGEFVLVSHIWNGFPHIERTVWVVRGQGTGDKNGDYEENCVLGVVGYVVSSD